jgi:parallel beta-helix repeat protein
VPADAGYVALINCTNITVQNLNLTNNGQGILVYSTTDSVITRNHIIDNRYDGIRLIVSQNINVTKNNITNNTHGIWMDGSSGSNIISENNIINNHENGINIYLSSGTAIVGNTLSGNNGSGIKLWSESDSNVISSNILANSTIGIQIEKSANNTISGNNITNNSDSGIHLWDSNSTIIGNNIIDNGFGIRVYSCSNVIHHNNFVKNTVQAYTDGSIGTWDNGSEGNYWSDYNGRDTNDNGIGDAPYLIDANNQDNYPLIQYWGSPTQQSTAFPTAWIVAVVATIVIVIAVVAGYLYYKRKK